MFFWVATSLLVEEEGLLIGFVQVLVQLKQAARPLCTLSRGHGGTPNPVLLLEGHRQVSSLDDTASPSVLARDPGTWFQVSLTENLPRV